MEIKKTEKVRGDGKSNEGWKKHVETIDESTMLGRWDKKGVLLDDKKLLFRSLLYVNDDPLK